MEVVDEQDQCWFLLQDGSHFYLNAACFHGAAQYSFEIALNEIELEQFHVKGRDFLNELAHDIHYSAPGVIGSDSVFKSRRVSGETQGEMLEAIIQWNKRERI